MVNIIPEETPRFSNPDDINAQIREFVLLKASLAHMETRSKELRDKIFEHLDNNGEVESTGSINLYLDEEIDGITRIEKQRRTTRKIDELKADDIIAEAGIGDEVYEMKRVINEDALMNAMWEGRITEAQLDEMFPATVTWALRTLKK